MTIFLLSTGDFTGQIVGVYNEAKVILYTAWNRLNIYDYVHINIFNTHVNKIIINKQTCHQNYSQAALKSIIFLLIQISKVKARDV